jgi:hypothetical protein
MSAAFSLVARHGLHQQRKRFPKLGHQALPHIGHLVPRRHDQRCLALRVHAAEPACVKKPLTPLPVTHAVGLAYLHRHAAARAGVAIPRNYNWLSSFHP